MSGGSLDYAYSKVEIIAFDVRLNATTSLHRTFARHLVRVAEALKAMEWMLSGDASPGAELDAIRKVISIGEELRCAVEDAKNSRKELDGILERIEKCQK